MVAPIGELAELNVPEGYIFTDAKGAKAFLNRKSNPIPEGLVGILAPTDGAWWLILAYTETGHVAEDGANNLNPDTILAGLQARVDEQNAERAQKGMVLVEQLEWAVQPVYHSTAKTLEWAVRARAGNDAVLNQTVRLFSRRGILDGIAVRPSQDDADLTQVRILMEEIRFKPGQQYADYTPGDKLSPRSMSELIVTPEDKKPAFHSIWVALGGVLLLVCFVAAGGSMLAKKLRAREPLQTGSVEAAKPSPLVPAAVAAPQPTRPVLIKTPVAKFKVKPDINGKGANGESRRRSFDYNRYFTDLMSTVYSGSYGVDMRPNGVGATNGYSKNGAAAPVNGGVNGYGQEILAAQQSLIAEQRRLIQEQSRLIEEKSRRSRKKV